MREDLEYTPEDIKAIKEWVKRHVETAPRLTLPLKPSL